MFKVNNKEARTTSMVSLYLTLSLTLRIMVSLMLTLNIFHILHNVKNAKIRALLVKKERNVTLSDCKLECISPKYISGCIWASPTNPSPHPPNRGSSSLSFVRIYAQGVLTRFYRIICSVSCCILIWNVSCNRRFIYLEWLQMSFIYLKSNIL